MKGNIDTPAVPMMPALATDDDQNAAPAEVRTGVSLVGGGARTVPDAGGRVWTEALRLVREHGLGEAYRRCRRGLPDLKIQNVARIPAPKIRTTTSTMAPMRSRISVIGVPSRIATGAVAAEVGGCPTGYAGASGRGTRESVP